jgi:hypothetical protein
MQQPLNLAPTVSSCCHLLRIYGLETFRHARFTSGREVIGVLTDQKSSEAFFGKPIFVQSRSGIRYRDAAIENMPTGENHRDICLATFAELGLPVSTPLTAVNGSYSLRDLLRDSVENFHLQQEELPWTAVAYALYFDSGVRWTNRFKESFGWDELTEALLATPFERGSCGGTHILYALCIIRRVDGTDALLSGSVRARLDEYLKTAIEAAVARQAGNGHWPMAWSAELPTSSLAPNKSLGDSALGRLVVTGHLLECLTLVPPDLEPPERVFRQAARWLCQALDDPQVLRETHFCPLTHALCAVRTLVDANRMSGAQR